MDDSVSRPADESEKEIALRADPSDPEDFDVSAEGVDKAIAERNERRSQL